MYHAQSLEQQYWELIALKKDSLTTQQNSPHKYTLHPLQFYVPHKQKSFCSFTKIFFNIKGIVVSKKANCKIP